MVASLAQGPEGSRRTSRVVLCMPPSSMSRMARFTSVWPCTCTRDSCRGAAAG